MWHVTTSGPNSVEGGVGHKSKDVKQRSLYMGHLFLFPIYTTQTPNTDPELILHQIHLLILPQRPILFSLSLFLYFEVSTTYLPAISPLCIRS
jgi:hypothetical protein